MTFRLEPAPVQRRWDGKLVIVAAPGPSLTKEVAEQCRGRRIVAVSDAYRLMPFADVLYSCDAKWWEHHQDCKGFQGEKWSSHNINERIGRHSTSNDKSEQARRFNLHIVLGRSGWTNIKDPVSAPFSTNPAFIHYGGNSGFQAVNLAILFGASTILLVGFDMREVNGKRHFFGEHPSGFKTSSYDEFIKRFNYAAAHMPAGVTIINCTPGSALTCFPSMDLAEALARKVEAA